MLTTTPRPAARLSASVARTLTLVALSQTELVWRLSVEAAKDPEVQLVPPEAGISRSVVLDPEGVAAEGGSLMAHVLHQINAMGLTQAERAIALVLAEALEPTGWLGLPVARIARVCGTPEAEVLAVLARLQAMEPGGLFARSLADCLRLQAEQAGELTPAMIAVLGALPVLASGGVAAVAAQSGVDAAAIAQAVGQMRAYDPKPGLGFADHGPIMAPADLLIQREGGEWQAVINPNRLSVNAPAPWRTALEGRDRIALSIGTLLARHQAGWLEGGAMAAITSQDIAAQTGFHLSTVNRALSALTARMPLGTAPLRRLVSHPVGRDGIAAADLRARIAALLREGNRGGGTARPSDETLSRQLAQQGVRVARRTVAKYRASLGDSG